MAEATSKSRRKSGSSSKRGSSSNGASARSRTASSSRRTASSRASSGGARKSSGGSRSSSAKRSNANRKSDGLKGQVKTARDVASNGVQTAGHAVGTAASKAKGPAIAGGAAIAGLVGGMTIAARGGRRRVLGGARARYAASVDQGEAAHAGQHDPRPREGSRPHGQCRAADGRACDRGAPGARADGHERPASVARRGGARRSDVSAAALVRAQLPRVRRGHPGGRLDRRRPASEPRCPDR